MPKTKNYHPSITYCSHFGSEQLTEQTYWTTCLNKNLTATIDHYWTTYWTYWTNLLNKVCSHLQNHWQTEQLTTTKPLTNYKTMTYHYTKVKKTPTSPTNKTRGKPTKPPNLKQTNAAARSSLIQLALGRLSSRGSSLAQGQRGLSLFFVSVWTKTLNQQNKDPKSTKQKP